MAMWTSWWSLPTFLWSSLTSVWQSDASVPTRYILQQPLTPNQITLIELGDWVSPNAVIFFSVIGVCFVALSTILGVHMFLCWLGQVVTRVFRTKPKKARAPAPPPPTSEPDIVRSLAPMVAASQWAALQQIEQIRQMVLVNPSAGAVPLSSSDSFRQETLGPEASPPVNPVSFFSPVSQGAPDSPSMSYSATPAPPNLNRPVTRLRTRRDCK